ncbi:MAG: hypothetical protein ACR2JV_05600 [Gaiellales bacterium]
MRIALALFLVALVGFCVATTTLVIVGTTGGFGLCLHYGALRSTPVCPHPPPAVWKTVVLLAPAAFLYLVIAPKHWPMAAVLWFWPVLFGIGAIRCAQLGLDHAGGIDASLLLAAVGCVIVGLIPIVGWRWNHVPREEPYLPREIFAGFGLAGIALLGVVAGFVYVSFVA